MPFSSVSPQLGYAREVQLRPLSHLSPIRLFFVTYMRSSKVFCSIGDQMLVFCYPFLSSLSSVQVSHQYKAKRSRSLLLLATWLLILCKVYCSAILVLTLPAIQALISESERPSVFDPRYLLSLTLRSMSFVKRRFEIFLPPIDTVSSKSSKASVFILSRNRLKSARDCEQAWRTPMLVLNCKLKVLLSVPPYWTVDSACAYRDYVFYEFATDVLFPYKCPPVLRAIL